MALAIEEKYDQVKQLIAMGKERGYLLYDEVNDILPAEVHSSEEIDDLLSTFERYGIDIYEDLAAAKAARATADPAAAEAPEVESKDDLPVAEESDLDLTPGMLEKTNDPVRMYLREMGTVPLLTRVIGGERKTIVVENEPAYNALYEIESPEVLVSDAWGKAVDQGRWPGLVRPFTKNRRHVLYRKLVP